MMAATVVPIRPDCIMTEPCIVCGHDVEGLYSEFECHRCGAIMHGECFWGRVATVAEWRDYLDRWIKPLSWDDIPAGPPPCVCPACRAKAGT